MSVQDKEGKEDVPVPAAKTEGGLKLIKSYNAAGGEGKGMASSNFGSLYDSFLGLSPEPAVKSQKMLGINEKGEWKHPEQSKEIVQLEAELASYVNAQQYDILERVITETNRTHSGHMTDYLNYILSYYLVGHNVDKE